jgi:hypothetical protein
MSGEIAGLDLGTPEAMFDTAKHVAEREDQRTKEAANVEAARLRAMRERDPNEVIAGILSQGAVPFSVVTEGKVRSEDGFKESEGIITMPDRKVEPEEQVLTPDQYLDLYTETLSEKDREGITPEVRESLKVVLGPVREAWLEKTAGLPYEIRQVVDESLQRMMKENPEAFYTELVSAVATDNVKGWLDTQFSRANTEAGQQARLKVHAAKVFNDETADEILSVSKPQLTLRSL